MPHGEGMTTNEETGVALMIPELHTKAELVTVSIRGSAHDHLMAWDASQRLVAIHESGHACAAAALGIAVRAIDITLRHGGLTQMAGAFEDTSLPWETSGRMLDNIAVALAGSSAERVILGEHTSGGESDNDNAVSIAMRWIKAGFAGPGVFVGEDGLAFGYLTDEVKTRTILRIQEVVAEAQVRADTLIAEHQEALIIVATAVYETRRLTDERLNAVLVSAGFTLPRPTA